MTNDPSGGAPSGEWSIPEPEKLDAQICQELCKLFDSGAFDSIGNILGGTLLTSNPSPENGLYLSFKLELTEFKRTPGVRPRTRIRDLGHIVVLATKNEQGGPPKIAVGITPSALDNTTPCPTCDGSGVSMKNLKTLTELPPRMFKTIWR